MKQRLSLAALILSFVLFHAVSSFAAEVPPPSPSSEPQSVSETETEGTPAESSLKVENTTTAPGNVTIDFKEADIQSVLRILSYKSGVNIIAGKDVTGLVTIRLIDVPWEKALDMVLKTYGYAYDRQDNIIRITTLENLKKEEMSTQVYTLNYAQAAEMEKSIKDVLTEKGTVRADERSNTLIVTDIPTSLQRVGNVVSRLDRTTPQVVIEAKIIETTLGDADRLGIKWSTKVKLSGSMRPTTFPFPAIQRTDYARFLPDPKLPTTTQAVSGGGAVTTGTEADFSPRAPNASFPVADKADFKFGTLDFSEFQALLEAIQERRDAKILSEPHVTTLNNQEAKILVGEILSIPTFERNSTTGRMEITGYNDRDVGIRLSVIPQINNQQEIVVTVHPEITHLLGYDDLSADIKAPRFSTREAKTQVRIRSGQTIAIGGLIREIKLDATTKVPILGDLPLLGNVFKFKDNSVEKTDLLFFLTVNIVEDKSAPKGHPAT